MGCWTHNLSGIFVLLMKCVQLQNKAGGQDSGFIVPFNFKHVAMTAARMLPVNEAIKLPCVKCKKKKVETQHNTQ